MSGRRRARRVAASSPLKGRIAPAGRISSSPKVRHCARRVSLTKASICSRLRCSSTIGPASVWRCGICSSRGPRNPATQTGASSRACLTARWSSTPTTRSPGVCARRPSTGSVMKQVGQHASQARRLQASGDLDAAMAEVETGLAAYPGDARLTVIADALKKDLGRRVPPVVEAAPVEATRIASRPATPANLPAGPAPPAETEERTRIVVDRRPPPADEGATTLRQPPPMPVVEPPRRNRCRSRRSDRHACRGWPLLRVSSSPALSSP